MQYGLSFRLAGDYTEDHVTRVQLLVGHMVKKRKWPAGLPDFFDEVEDASELGPHDYPARFVGGFVPLHRPRPALAPATDRADFEATAYVVEQLVDFTGKLDLTVELELGGTGAGRIRAGVADELVTVGLLGEWERVLLSSGH